MRRVWGPNILADLYWNNSFYNEAKPLYKRALEIYEKINGPEHPDLDITNDYLAVLYKKIGENKEEKKLKEQANENRGKNQ